MRMKRLLVLSSMVIAAAMLSGCSSTGSAVGSYDSNGVYDRPMLGANAIKSMSYEGIERNPVIVVHGFLGSKLKDTRTGASIFGSFTGLDAMRGYSNEQLKGIAIPMEIGKPLKDLKSDVQPYSIMGNVDVRILGIHFSMEGYDTLLGILEKCGYIPEFKPLPEGKHFSSLFVFYYDWRGSKYVDKLVVVATPNAGYLDTFVEMQNGLKMAPELEAYPQGIIGTWATYYQMLPLVSTRSLVYKDDPDGKPIDIFDPEVWIKYNWGLADPRQDEALKIILPDAKTAEERHAVAIDHLKKCLKRARQFTDAMKIDTVPPDDVALYLFVGDAVPTRRVAQVDRKTGGFEVTEFETGDGKVLAISARMDDREGATWRPFAASPVKWQTIIHIAAAHMGITTSPEFAKNMGYHLLEATTKKQAEKRKQPFTPAKAN